MGSRIQFGKILATMAWCGMITSPLLGEQPASTSRQRAIPDVLLSQGEMRGQVLDGEGRPLAHQDLMITREGRFVDEVRTDAKGRFVGDCSETGVYRLAVAHHQLMVRGWDESIAPPAAKPGVLVVADDSIRGQAPCPCEPSCPPGCSPVRHRLACLFGNPWVLGLGIATAVAVPLVVNNDDDDTVRGNGNLGEGEPDDQNNGS